MTARPNRARRKRAAQEAPDGTDPSLVRFDRKTWSFLCVLFFGLLIATSFRLHGSSIAIWKTRLPSLGSEANTLWGLPKNIRIDEWGLITPAMLSQAKQHPSFPQVNPSWGTAESPLVMNIPIRHPGILFRPQYWGFFLLDLERAFAFYWNMKMFLLNAGVFLLLMLLTGNDFWVSLLGTGWVFFSGYVQWWYSTPAMLPEMIGCFALVVVAAQTLALSPRKGVIAAAALLLAGSAINFALCFYPPFQVSLAYLAAALLIGTVGPRLTLDRLRVAARFRAASAGLAALLIGLVLASYAWDARETIGLLRGTVYPGARTSLGGDVSLARIFGGFYGFFISESRFPRAWDNVCEASSFVLLFPLPLTYMVWRMVKRRWAQALEWSLLSYIGIVLIWMAVGWPRPLVAISGFGLVQGVRGALGLGLASIFWCCVFLSRKPEDEDSLTTRRKLVWAGSFVLLSALFGLYFNRSLNRFLSDSQVLLVSVMVGAATFSLLARHRIAFAACVLVPNCLSFGLINPVAVGLGAITGTELHHRVERIVAEDPEARWIVYGDYLIADLIKAAGARVFNGTLFVPPIQELQVLDPQLLGKQVYNRYAHVSLVALESSKIAFRLSQAADQYAIGIDPKSAAWWRLGIRYVVLRSQSTDPGFQAAASLVAAIPQDRIWIYKYNWKRPGDRE